MTPPSVHPLGIVANPEASDAPEGDSRDVPLRLSSTRGLMIIGITAAARLIDDM